MTAAATTSGRRRVHRRGAALLAGCLLAGGVLAGCGEDADQVGGDTGAQASADPSLGTVTTDAEGVQEVTIETPDDYVFVPDSFTVAPGRVRLTVRNVAEQMTHNFRFTPGQGPEEIPEQIPVLSPGESQTIEFEVTATGDHPFECSFHVQLQQVGTMTVAG
ncbi:cupredoxin domain-containing protein [Blastococcus sp. SYSU D00820]